MNWDAIDDAIITGARMLKLYEMLNLNQREREILAYLMLSGGWSIKGLSKESGYSRASIRQYLKDFMLMGIVEADEDETYSYTPDGRALARHIAAECMQITFGDQVGFSEALLDELEKRTVDGLARPFKNSARLRNVKFSIPKYLQRNTAVAESAMLLSGKNPLKETGEHNSRDN